jgi:hypothetical protein
LGTLFLQKSKLLDLKEKPWRGWLKQPFLACAIAFGLTRQVPDPRRNALTRGRAHARRVRGDLR